MSRIIRLSIAPATATHCGDGDGSHCQMLHFRGASALCRAFPLAGSVTDTTGSWHFARLPECIKAEVTHD